MRKAAAPALIPLLFLGACGGGSGGVLGGTTTTSPTQTIASAAPNVVTLEVDAGPAALPGPAVNTAFVSVTVCQPGTTNCETIPDIEVDTGSYGLRLVYGALGASFAATLPQQMAGTLPVAECAVFAIGYSWGSVRSADVTISGETASSIPINMIGDPAFPNVPTSCSDNVPTEAEDTVATFGANGILGVGPFVPDCGDACAQAPVPGTYYTCASNGATCTAVIQPTSLQVSNPVGSFTADNNGVIIELPPVTDSGAQSATGALVFGIGTETNNGLNGATVLPSDPTSGEISAAFNGASYPESFIDSGSNAFYFVDSSIPTCGQETAAPGFFCPTSTESLSAQLSGTNGANVTVGFDVGNAVDLATDNPTGTAFPDLGVPNTIPQSFDLGLTFFYGRNVFTAIAGASTPGGTGPYFAY